MGKHRNRGKGKDHRFTEEELQEQAQKHALDQLKTIQTKKILEEEQKVQEKVQEYEEKMRLKHIAKVGIRGQIIHHYDGWCKCEPEIKNLPETFLEFKINEKVYTSDQMRQNYYFQQALKTLAQELATKNCGCFLKVQVTKYEYKKMLI